MSGRTGVAGPPAALEAWEAVVREWDVGFVASEVEHFWMEIGARVLPWEWGRQSQTTRRLGD